MTGLAFETHKYMVHWTWLPVAIFMAMCSMPGTVINFQYNSSNNYNNPSRQVHSLLLSLRRMMSTLVMNPRPFTWKISEVECTLTGGVSHYKLSTLKFS